MYNPSPHALTPSIPPPARTLTVVVDRWEKTNQHSLKAALTPPYLPPVRPNIHAFSAITPFTILSMSLSVSLSLLVYCKFRVPKNKMSLPLSSPRFVCSPKRIYEKQIFFSAAYEYVQGTARPRLQVDGGTDQQAFSPPWASRRILAASEFVCIRERTHDGITPTQKG